MSWWQPTLVNASCGLYFRIFGSNSDLHNGGSLRPTKISNIFFGAADNAGTTTWPPPQHSEDVSAIFELPPRSQAPHILHWWVKWLPLLVGNLCACGKTPSTTTNEWPQATLCVGGLCALLPSLPRQPLGCPPRAGVCVAPSCMVMAAWHLGQGSTVHHGTVLLFCNVCGILMGNSTPQHSLHHHI